MKKTVDAEFFAKICCPGHLEANRAGDLLFAVKTPNIDKDRYDTAHWLWQNSRLRRLRLPAGVGACRWWDETTLLLATRGDAADRRRAKKGLPVTVFKTLGMQRGAKAQTLFALHAQAERAWPLPGGGALVLARWDPAVDAALAEAEGDPDKAAALLEKRQSCTVWEELPFWENGDGMVRGQRRRLYLWAGGEPQPLTGPEWEVEDASLAPNGQMAYLIVKTWREGVAETTHRLYALDLADKTCRDLTFAPLRLDVCLPLEDGCLLVAGSDMQTHGLNQNPGYYRLAPDGAATPLAGGGQYGLWPSVNTDVNQPGPPRWQARGDNAYFMATVGGASHLLRLCAKTGAVAPVTRAAGMVSEIAPAPHGWYAVAMRGGMPPEVWQVTEDGKETQITFLNNIDDFSLAEPVELCVKSGGEDIHGWVMLPPHAPVGAAGVPGLLYIHGGPKTAYGPVLFHEMQYWAAQGYAVLLCNPRGSDGQGDPFADIRGDYGGQDCRDLLAFLDAALEKYPAIDQNRLAVAGGSYGGFMVNWLIGHTGRFAAAVSQRGIASWGTMALMSDIGYYFVPDQTGVNDWRAVCADPEKSPLAHVQNARTPTLFLHSDEDYRCPLPEGAQMYAALKLLGVPTRMVVFHGENHDLSRSGGPKNRLRRLEEMRAWLHKYLQA